MERTKQGVGKFGLIRFLGGAFGGGLVGVCRRDREYFFELFSEEIFPGNNLERVLRNFLQEIFLKKFAAVGLYRVPAFLVLGISCFGTRASISIASGLLEKRKVR